MKHLTKAMTARRPRSAIASRLMVTAVALAGVVLAACSGSSTSSPGSTSGPGATSAGAVDPCLVGTWTTIGLSENSPANDERIAYSGGAGEVFTISAQGAVTIDTHAARQVVFVSAGQTFTATVTGTARGTLTTAGGTFMYEPSGGDTLTTNVVDSTGTALGPPKPDLPFNAVYTCTAGQSLTFYKTVVSYMIDGPKIPLIAGTGNSSSTANPSPS
jgi:hypothetical protein